MPRKKKKDFHLVGKVLVTGFIFALFALFKEPSKHQEPEYKAPIKITHEQKNQAKDQLEYVPEPIRSLTKAGQAIILDMGKKQMEHTRKVQKEAIAAAKNRRPMRNVLANDEVDMPPWEHPHKWGRISSEHGTCWHHYETMRKVCE